MPVEATTPEIQSAPQECASLKLMGCLAQKELPANALVKQTVHGLCESIKKHENEVSPQAKATLRRISAFLKAGDDFLTQRNHNQRIQQFVSHAKTAAAATSKDTLIPEDEQYVLRSQARHATRAIQTFVTLVLTSPEFRRVLRILADMATILSRGSITGDVLDRLFKHRYVTARKRHGRRPVLFFHGFP